MAAQSLLPAGDFRTTYAADTTMFPDRDGPQSRSIIGVGSSALAPLVLSEYWLSMLIQIGIFGIAALGLNILVGFTGQISIGHAAFFGLGAFTSAYLGSKLPIPVFFAIPLAGSRDRGRGLIFGLPAARLKGLYLAIATLAAQYILLDFFRAPNGSPAASCRQAPAVHECSAMRCAGTGSISTSSWPSGRGLLSAASPT